MTCPSIYQIQYFSTDFGKHRVNKKFHPLYAHTIYKFTYQYIPTFQTHTSTKYTSLHIYNNIILFISDKVYTILPLSNIKSDR